MDDAIFIKDPSKVLWQYLQTKRRPMVRELYEYGKLAMALEIITVVKTLDSLPVISELGRQETVSVLQTLLTDMGLDELAYDVYEQLNEWRRPKFDAYVEDLYARASELGTPSGGSPPPQRLEPSQQERRSLDPSSSPEGPTDESI